MMAGNPPSSIVGDERSCLVWDMGYKRYVAGNPTNAVTESLRTGIEEWLRVGHRLAVVVPLSSDWKESLPKILAGYRLSNETMLVYRHTQTRRPVDTPAYLFKPIDREIVGRSAEDFEEVSHMWGTADRFLDNGFGWACVCEDKVVGWCTSEYQSRERCGLGIEVLPDHRRRGLATSLAIRTAQTGREFGLAVYWECNSLNQGSIDVALKAGFESFGQYPIVVVEPISGS